MTTYNPGDIVKYRYNEDNIGLVKIINFNEDDDEYYAEWIEVPPRAAFYSWNAPGNNLYVQTNHIIGHAVDETTPVEDEEFVLVFDNDEVDVIVQSLIFSAQFNANEGEAIESLRLARKIAEES